jgi:two-component system sensor histidine kinase UhpB
MGGQESGRGMRIETRREGERRVAWWMPPAYVAAWVALFSVSSIHWFLPAGLRLAALWLLPRRYWPAMAATEFLTILGVTLARGQIAHPATMLLVAIVPWCLYAVIVDRFGRPAGPTPTPHSMMRFLLCGMGAAIATAMSLLAILRFGEGSLPRPAIGMLYGFAIGDFIGILVVAPLARTVLAQFGPHKVPWQSIFANGLVLLPVATVLALSALPMRSVPLYPVVLAVFPHFWLSFQYGWRASGLALAITSATVHGLGAGSIGASWPLPELQLLVAAAGFAGLALGISSDALRTQGRALKSTIDMLSVRTRALADAANRLVSQQEAERRRIGAELHDQLGQDMTAIATRLRLVERAHDPADVEEGMRSLRTLVDDAHEHLREAIQSLHPLVLHRFGLARALGEGPMRELARDNGIEYLCTIEGDVDALPEDIAAALYRICQEATTNGVRHGCGGRIVIHLSRWPHEGGADVRLLIEDDGGSFAPGGGSGLGLQNIHDRADAIGASYAFDPASGHPRHVVEVRVPV